jgi:hypothetical protein
MRRVLETELGKQLYGKCQVTIEPVFANTKFNRRIDRFLRRGRAAWGSEWRPITATHNLLKLHAIATVFKPCRTVVPSCLWIASAPSRRMALLLLVHLESLCIIVETFVPVAMRWSRVCRAWG